MTNFFKSLAHALEGINEVLSEPNFKIEIVAAILAIIASFVLETSLLDKEIIVLCIGIVLGSEIVNTSVEQLADFISPSHHDKIRIVKDLMAAAVLIFSLMALIIGIIIFGNALLYA